MLDELPTTSLVMRLATPDDIPLIELLDSFSTSPNRDIHRDMEKYFGSIDPSTHERTLIFLAEVDGNVAAKIELMLPSSTNPHAVGYIKRVVAHPRCLLDVGEQGRTSRDRGCPGRADPAVVQAHRADPHRSRTRHRRL